MAGKTEILLSLRTVYKEARMLSDINKEKEAWDGIRRICDENDIDHYCVVMDEEIIDLLIKRGKLENLCRLPK